MSNKISPAMSKLHILVAEDIDETRLTIVAMLKQLGYKNITDVEDGRKALEVFDKAHQPFDIIISDWNMPQVDGAQLIRDIRTAYPKIPFLMVTGFRDENSVQDALKCGVTGYLVKPFNLEDLQKKLEHIVEEISSKASNAHIETNRILQKHYKSNN